MSLKSKKTDERNKVWERLKRVEPKPSNGMIRFDNETGAIKQYIDGKWYPIEARN